MLNQQTIEKLYAMRMRGMAEAFTQQQEDPQTTPLSFEERFALLVDRQWNWRQNRALERRLKEGRLQGPACIEDIDFRAARGLDHQVIRSLLNDSDWVRRHQHIPGRSDRDWENVSGAGVRTESLPRRIHRLLRHGRAVISGVGTGSGGWQLREKTPRAGTGGCVDRRRLGDGAADRPGTPGLPGDLRPTLPHQVDPADQPVAGSEVARADRRSDGTDKLTKISQPPRRTTGPIGASTSSIRKTKKCLNH